MIFNLSKYETLIYETLLRFGKLNAKEISHKSRVPKTAVYPTMQRLVEKGFVQEYKGAVSTFEAIKPSVAFEGFASRSKEEIDKQKEGFIDKYSAIDKESKFSSESIISLLNDGIEQSIVLSNKMIKQCKKSYFILGWTFSKKRTLHSFLAKIKELIKKGVDVRIIITQDGDKQVDLISMYKESGVKMRSFPVKNTSISIVDGKICKISLRKAMDGKRVNLKIDDEEMSGFMHEYFLQVWKKSHTL